MNAAHRRHDNVIIRVCIFVHQQSVRNADSLEFLKQETRGVINTNSVQHAKQTEQVEINVQFSRSACDTCHFIKKDFFFFKQKQSIHLEHSRFAIPKVTCAFYECKTSAFIAPVSDDKRKCRS